MQIHVFTIPIHHSESPLSDLNRFLSSHRVAEIHREFVQDGPNSAWTVCVTTDSEHSKAESPQRNRVDYREVLSEEDFAVFAKLRTLRKQIAEQEGVPPYALFTNEQLAEIVRRRIETTDALKEINGIGPARIQKYGERFLSEMRNAADGTHEGPDTTTS
jgi:superfamily II DNA helicase RecQ